MTDGELQVEEIEETGFGWAECVARCVGGVVRPGDRFDGDRLTVERLDRPLRRALPFIDPPHAVRVRFTGPGVPDLRPRLTVSTAGPRRYGYIGPPELRRAVPPDSPGGTPIRTAADFAAWAAAQSRTDLAAPFTYVIDPTSTLRLAPRPTEHVACAARGPVLSAGEITWTHEPDGSWSATEVTNLSTGYAPDPSSWPSVAAALETAGLSHPGGFTFAFVFRRCPEAGCAQLNVVREGVYECAVCGAGLPEEWNAAGE
ncbi:hypothetical protein [Streptomyces sp. NPDC048623]|uniref:hypothetical protein n=1 Tax=Streptomyces sp. NPDC048623 TaxID=3155761 RepID=UPI003433BF6B